MNESSRIRPSAALVLYGARASVRHCPFFYSSFPSSSSTRRANICFCFLLESAACPIFLSTADSIAFCISHTMALCLSVPKSKEASFPCLEPPITNFSLFLGSLSEKLMPAAFCSAWPQRTTWDADSLFLSLLSRARSFSEHSVLRTLGSPGKF